MRTEVKDFTPDEAVLFGLHLEEKGDVANAEQMYRSVLIVVPDHFHAMFRLGTLLSNKKEYYEALYRLNRACKIDRKNDLAIANRAMVLSVLGHHDEAISDFERALYIDPNNYMTLSNFGVTLEQVGRYEEAINQLDKALAIEPDNATTHHSRGVALYRLGRIEEAIEACDATLRLMPDHHQAKYNRGLSKLFSGDLTGGFADCEAALLTTDIRKPLFGPFPHPQWDGDYDTKGRTLMIMGEQGIGDTIHFMRFLPFVKQRVDKVILAIHEAVRPLYRPPGIRVLMSGETSPPFDMQCPLLSLPHRLGMADPPPPPLPLDWYNYVGRMPHWETRILGGADERLRVGLCWAGNQGHRHDKDRSIALETFAPLLKVPGVNLYGLQKEIRPLDAKALAGMAIESLGDDLKSFKDTAAVIAMLDLVISVDTSVAHLAASLGKPTWLLLSAFGTDWRWQRQRTDSPWYPTMRLFRQSERGQWTPVMRMVASELMDLVSAKRAA